MFDSNPSYKHALGICVQPTFFFADSSLLIQFFEYWIIEGATKIYLYWESFSKEVNGYPSKELGV